MKAAPKYATLPADAITDDRLVGVDLKVLALLGRRRSAGRFLGAGREPQYTRRHPAGLNDPDSRARVRGAG